MPAPQWLEQPLNGGRTEDFDWTAYDGQDPPQPLALSAGDVVRFKLAATEGGEPIVDADSLGPGANGSAVTIAELGEAGVTPASGTVRIGQEDTRTLERGRYFGELTLVDDSETNPADAIKPIVRGTFKLTPSPTGNIGLTNP